jgi:hypothetical protein
VQPIWDFSVAETARYEVTDYRDCVVSERGHHLVSCSLKVGTEVAFIKVRKTGPDPRIEVRPYAEAEPVLERDVPLEYWLENTTKWICLLLREFSAPPPEIRELVIDPDRLALAFGSSEAAPHPLRLDQPSAANRSS